MWHAWKGREKCTGFWWEIQKDRDHLEDQGIDGITMHLREIGWESVKWLEIEEDRCRWRALVNTVMNLRLLPPWS
jgi:hypothetical protein